MQKGIPSFIDSRLRPDEHWHGVGWKPWLFVCLIAAWLLALVLPVPARAQTPIQITSTSVKVDYPQSFSFRIQAQSTSDITKVAIRYRFDRLACVTNIVSEAWPEFTPAARVDTTWVWQMKKTGGLPPGAKLQYSWLIVDSKGQRLETPWAAATFYEARYSWKSASDGMVALYWYEGDQNFARSLLSAGAGTLKRMAQDTGTKLERPVSIYIYASTDALQSARIFAPAWEGGVAFPDFGIIAIGVPPSALDWGQKTVAHELTHVLTFQMTRNCYGDPPTWLSEGLSVYAEGELDPGQQRRLQRAIADNTLFSARTLSGPFPAQSDQALLSYAESYSLVNYLITKYGSDKMTSFLAAFKDGLSDDEALNRVYGLDTDKLDAQWRASVGAPSRPVPVPRRQSSLTPVPFATVPSSISPFASQASAPAHQSGTSLVRPPDAPDVAIPTAKKPQRVGGFLILGVSTLGLSAFGWTRRERR